MFAIDLNFYFTLVASLTMFFLGVFVYYHDNKSVTNIIFFTHSSVVAVWSIINYYSLILPPDSALFFIRLVICLAIPHVFFVYIFVMNFPSTGLVILKRKLFLLLLLMFIMMAVSFTPFVFEKVLNVENKSMPVAGPLMPAFALIFVSFSFLTMMEVIKKFFRSQDLIKRQWASIGLGLIISYTLLIVLVFLQVVLFKNTFFVDYSPLFILPISVGISYALLKHGLFNVKVIATELFTVGLLLVLLLQIFFSTSVLDFTVALIVLFLFFIFSILLIKSIINEFRQKEKVAKLAASLETANLRLQELDRQKTEFLSIASHQLRTPMSIIKGYIELIQDGAYGKITKETFKILADMDETNERLVKLIDEFLDISRIEQGRTKFTFERKDMNELINSVTKELTQRAKDKKLGIEWKPGKGKQEIVMDEEKVRHVVFNFIDNAIKYSLTGAIKVSLEREKNGMTVRVKDNGIGFDKVDEANFFQKFYRGRNVKNTNVGGTGLGIYVTKQFIEKHGGEVWAKSEGLGKGGEFGFWIPNNEQKLKEQEADEIAAKAKQKADEEAKAAEVALKAGETKVGEKK